MTGQSFNRTGLLVGTDAMRRLAEARVCVIGLGGVGSYAAEALARAGIGHLTLIDFDVVGKTNLNRQIIALQSTVGEAKTDVMASRIKDINPKAEIITHQVFLDSENRRDLLAGHDYYIDAIDSLGPKIGLLEHAAKAGLEIISVMGAGNRLDPSQIHLAPLKKSVNCPLARRVRKFLRRRGIDGNFPCVYSSELPLMPEDSGDIPEEIILQRGRQRKTIGSVSYMPAIMGMFAASWVIRQIVRPDAAASDDLASGEVT
jgi:tRNA A37 threonylcarbamoyladenosine dehydratase